MIGASALIDAAVLRDTQAPIRLAESAPRLQHTVWRSKAGWAVIAIEGKAYGRRC